MGVYPAKSVTDWAASVIDWAASVVDWAASVTDWAASVTDWAAFPADLAGLVIPFDKKVTFPVVGVIFPSACRKVCVGE